MIAFVALVAFTAGVVAGFWVCATSAEKAHPGFTCEQAQQRIDAA